MPSAAYRSRMRLLRICTAALTLASVTACTPDITALVDWITERETAASAAGLPCPIYADDLAWRGLPERFLYVIERESRCDPGAVNASSGALGLTQVMPSWLPTLCREGIACARSDLLNAQRNLDAAALIYSVQGADAWSQTW